MKSKLFNMSEFEKLVQNVSIFIIEKNLNRYVNFKYNFIVEMMGYRSIKF